MTVFDEMYENLAKKVESMEGAYDASLAKEANLIAQIEMCQRSLAQLLKDRERKEERNAELKEGLSKLDQYRESMNQWGVSRRFDPVTQAEEYDAHGLDESNWEKTVKELNKKIHGRG